MSQLRGCWGARDLEGLVAGPESMLGMVVELHPSTPIVPGETGTRTSIAVSLGAFYADGEDLSWVTPATCTIDLLSNACAPTATEPNLYVLSGTGTCPQAAAPYMTNTAPPVTVGDFSFATEYVPPDQ